MGIANERSRAADSGCTRGLRILFTVDPELPVPPQHYGGIERVVALWIREARSRGLVVGLCANRESSEPVDAFFPWPGTRSQHRMDTFANTISLLRAAASFHPDVIHSSSRLAYLLPHLGRRRPVVMSYQRHPGARQVRLAAWMGGSRLAFTGVSDFICREGRLGGGKWRAVWNCVDIAATPHTVDTPADAPLVFLSRVEAIKGVHTAIAIARRAGVPLVIAGNHSADASARSYWEGTIQPEIDGRHVRYVGAVDDTEKRALLAKARALVVPVEWDEPFGIVFAEALAAGTPVISTPRGALPEIVRHGETGFLIRSMDEGVHAVRRLDAISRQACRSDAEARFSPAVAFDSLLQVYRGIGVEA